LDERDLDEEKKKKIVKKEKRAKSWMLWGVSNKGGKREELGP